MSWPAWSEEAASADEAILPQPLPLNLAVRERENFIEKQRRQTFYEGYLPDIFQRQLAWFTH